MCDDNQLQISENYYRDELIIYYDFFFIKIRNIFYSNFIHLYSFSLILFILFFYIPFLKTSNNTLHLINKVKKKIRF